MPIGKINQFETNPYSGAELTSSTPKTCLPNEILLFIFSKLHGKDAAKCSRVCWEWKQLVDEKTLWKQLISRDFPTLETIDASRELYRDSLIHSNLIRGISTSTTLQADDTEAISAFVFTQSRQLVSGSQNGTIRIWDLETGKWSKLRGHTSKITSLLCTEQGQLISGSIDGKIMIWDLDKKCLINVLRNQGWVSSLISTKDGLLISGSMEGTIKIWKLNKVIHACDVLDKIEVCTLQERGSEISSLILKEKDQLVTGSADGRIQIWDLNTRSCLCSFQTETIHRITALILTKQGLLISGCMNGAIKVYNLDTMVYMTLQKDGDWITSLTLTQQGLLISSSLLGQIKVWDLKMMDLINTLPKEEKWVGSLILTKHGKLISGSLDGLITVKDFAHSTDPLDVKK